MKAGLAPPSGYAGSMQVKTRYILLALFVGPGAHWLAGYQRRAVGWAIAAYLASSVWPYWLYLQAFAELDSGGDTARELTNTCLRANEAMFATAASWLPVTIAVLAIANVACALDLAWQARRAARGPALAEPAV